MQEDKFDIHQEIEHFLTRHRGAIDKLQMKGVYLAHHFRGGKFLKTYLINNDITNEGKNLIFDTMFNSATQIATWYSGLISLSGYSALAAADVMNSHAGWTEATGYTQANRVTWGVGAASGQAVTNASPMTFDMNATATIKGIFITSNNTKSGTSGKLWSTGLFSADVPVVNGDQLKITYTLNA